MNDFFPFTDFSYYRTCMLSRIEKNTQIKFQESIAFQSQITKSLIESNYSKANMLKNQESYYKNPNFIENTRNSKDLFNNISAISYDKDRNSRNLPENRSYHVNKTEIFNKTPSMIKENEKNSAFFKKKDDFDVKTRNPGNPQEISQNMRNNSFLQEEYQFIGEIYTKYIEDIEKFEEFLLSIEESPEKIDISVFFSKEKLYFSFEKSALCLISFDFPKIISLIMIEDLKIERIPNRNNFLVAVKLKETLKEYEKTVWDFKFLVFHVTNKIFKEFFEGLKTLKSKENQSNFYKTEDFLESSKNAHEKSSVLEIIDPYELLKSQDIVSKKENIKNHEIDRKNHEIDRKNHEIDRKNHETLHSNKEYGFTFNRKNENLKENDQDNENLEIRRIMPKISQAKRNTETLEEQSREFEKKENFNEVYKEHHHHDENNDFQQENLEINEFQGFKNIDSETIKHQDIINHENSDKGENFHENQSFIDNHSHEQNKEINEKQMTFENMSKTKKLPEKKKNEKFQKSSSLKIISVQENQIKTNNFQEDIIKNHSELKKSSENLQKTPEIHKSSPNLKKSTEKSFGNMQKNEIINKSSEISKLSQPKLPETPKIFVNQSDNLSKNQNNKKFGTNFNDGYGLQNEDFQQILKKHSEILKQGKFFLKFGRKDLFRPSKRKICFDDNLTRFYWGKGKKIKAFSLDEIIEIRYGRNTDNFKRFGVGNKEKNKLCFSIVMIKRSIDLQAPNLKEKELFLEALNQIMAWKKSLILINK